jgi:hypothetical protein
VPRRAQRGFSFSDFAWRYLIDNHKFIVCAALAITISSANRLCLTVPADADPGHIPAAAPVALWSQYSSFFLENESWHDLHGEPRSLQGYDVAKFYWKATHLRGRI